MSNEQQGQSIAQEGQGSYDGDIILDTLEMGTGQGFNRVAKYWLENGCVSFAEARQDLAKQQEQIQDFHTPLKDWTVKVVEEGIRFVHKPTDGEYAPTEHALNLMCQMGRGMSTWMARSMTNPIPHATKKDDDGDAITIEGGERTTADFEVLRDYILVHLFNPERVDQEKLRLLRTWTDGTLRAFLSEQYCVVNNGWFLEVLEKAIPGGVVSHWKGDADNMYGNILIPDTIRTEPDSDFGGMLSVGNSEIGTRRVTSLPSVFRAICMNGCIWDQKSGEGINKVHRGKVDFKELEGIIIENLQSQIPLLPQGIQKLLGLRTFGCGDTSPLNLLAETSIKFGMSKKQISEVYGCWNEEIRLLGTKDGKTAYGLANAVTRAGQRFSNADWIRFDIIGGQFTEMARDDWDKFRSRADGLTDKDLKKRLGELVTV